MDVKKILNIFALITTGYLIGLAIGRIQNKKCIKETENSFKKQMIRNPY